jgi:hypothetical protein
MHGFDLVDAGGFRECLAGSLILDQIKPFLLVDWDEFGHAATSQVVWASRVSGDKL